MTRGIRRLLAGVVTIAIAILGFQLAGTVSASAHSNAVIGTVTCQSDGTYTVSWTVKNDYNETETATVTSQSPTASTVSPSVLKLATYGSGAIVQTGIAGSATSAALTVQGTWDGDNYSRSNDGSVTLAGTCQKSKAPAPATATNGQCVNREPVDPIVTIPSDTDVSYTLDGTSKGAGTYPVSPGHHLVVASSSSVTLTGQTSFPFDLTAAPGDCSESVTPATPTFTVSKCVGYAPTGSTYTIPSTVGVDYLIGGVKLAARVYEVQPNTLITITVHPQPGYKLTGQTTFTHNYGPAPICTKDVTPAQPMWSNSVCVGNRPTVPTYTIVPTAGVDYYVGTAKKAAGVYPATGGSTVTITAQAQRGYLLPGGGTALIFKHVFSAKVTCSSPVAAATVKFSDDKCATAGPTGASYTVPTTTGVAYTVDGVRLAPGTYPATDGTATTILATAKAGYTLAGVTQWTHKFAAKPAICLGVEANNAHVVSSGGGNPTNGGPTTNSVSGGTASTGVPVTDLVLFGIALLFAGTACFAGGARRRGNASA